MSTLTNTRKWAAEHRALIVIFALLLGGAAVLRLLTFERYLPYEDYPDEVTYFLLGQYQWHFPDPAYLELERYPAHLLYPYISGAVQKLYQWLHPQPYYMLADYLYVLRLLSVALGVLTTLAMIGAAWQLGGPVAGWLAGFVWGYAPLIVEHNSLAYPDPLNYFFLACLFAITLHAWKRQSPAWLLGSLVLGIAVIFTKIWPITSVLPFVVAALALTVRQPRRMRGWLVLYALIAGASAAFLVWKINPLGVSNSSQEIRNFRRDGFRAVLDPVHLANNFRYGLLPIGEKIFWLGVITGLLAYFYNKAHRLRTVSLGYAALAALFVLLTTMLTASFIWVDLARIRHVLPNTIVLTLLWSVLVTQTLWALRHFLARYFAIRWKLTFAAALPVLLIFTALAPRYALGNMALIRAYQRPHVAEVLWKWADINVPNDGIVLSNERSELERTWNRVWGGYNGDRQREWWYENAEEIAQHTPEDYIQRGIMYFMFTDNDRQSVFADPALDAFIERLTLVKIIPAGNDKVAGSTAYFYRMAPPQVAADFDYSGQIRLVGYDMSGTQYDPGDTITFRPYWRIEQRPQSNYSMFIHLYPADELQVIAQYDGAPTDPRRPTLTWDDPDELYIGPDAQIHLPQDLPSGNYRLAVGIYDYLNGQRLLDAEGSDFFEIPIKVRAP